MSKFQKTLYRLAGKTLFVLGLSLCVLMLFFGFWPSLLYIIILVIGILLLRYDESDENDVIEDPSKKQWSKVKTIFTNLKPIKFTQLKHVLTTAILTYIAVIIIGISIVFLGKNYLNQRDTITECKLISASLDKYNTIHNTYPDNLETLISSNPLHASWSTDKWGQPYKYNKTSRKGFTLISAGADGKFNTNDDIKFNH